MEKPILFNTAMVKAILEGRKICTRRIIKRTPSNDEACGYGFWKEYNERDKRWYVKDYTHAPVWWTLEEYISKFSRYHVGDILYVRETWKQYEKRVGKGEQCHLQKFYGYKADADNPNNPSEFYEGNWKPSIHMPKEAARIFLKVTNVRIERLQDITKDDILAEGTYYDKEIYDMPCNIDNAGETYLRGCFMRLWNSTIDKKCIDMYGWGRDPWVWVIEFERIDLQNEGV